MHLVKNSSTRNPNIASSNIAMSQITTNKRRMLFLSHNVQFIAMLSKFNRKAKSTAVCKLKITSVLATKRIGYPIRLQGKRMALNNGNHSKKTGKEWRSTSKATRRKVKYKNNKKAKAVSMTSKRTKWAKAPVFRSFQWALAAKMAKLWDFANDILHLSIIIYNEQLVIDTISWTGPSR